MIAELTANDAAVIIAACAAAFGAVVGGIIKLAQVLTSIKQTTEHVNNAVNNRRDPHELTLRALVEQIDNRLDTLRSQSRNWHQSNVHRIDRLADAVGGVNRRLDNLERQQKGPYGSESDT